jgi:hypothetical protein
LLGQCDLPRLMHLLEEHALKVKAQKC